MIFSSFLASLTREQLMFITIGALVLAHASVFTAISYTNKKRTNTARLYAVFAFITGAIGLYFAP